MRIGVEVGGTFTDLVAVDDAGNLIATAKVPSSRDDPSVGALEALKAVDIPGAVVVHGSTVATNAVLERTGASTAFVTTLGFGDLLEIQRHDRTTNYDLSYQKPRPLVSRDHVVEIHERIAGDGSVVAAVDSEQAARAITTLVEREGIESVAVSFLNAYRTDSHEVAVRDALRVARPDLYVSLSSAVLPQFREYERSSTAIIDAYVKPLIDTYVAHLEKELRLLGARQFWMMESNGGVLPQALISSNAVRTVLSGPAAGVTAAIEVAGTLGFRDLITFDMGGTSTDVCLVVDGRAQLSTESRIDGLPIAVPMLEVTTVGAGGGSIAWLDAGGMLQVGPQSAGAYPGPASYGLGGSLPTVTDAHVFRGLIRPEAFLGGRMALSHQAAQAAIESLAKDSSLTPEDAADGIVAVTNANMAAAIRLVTIERGFDPADLTLVAFGGAGGLHAAALAEELGIRRVIVPAHPGLLSAVGLVVADLRRDYVRTVLRTLDNASAGWFSSLLAELEAEAYRELHDEAPERVNLRATAELRYLGQAYELSVPVELPVGEGTPSKLRSTFEQLHQTRFGYRVPDAEVQFVNLRLEASVPSHAPSLSAAYSIHAEPVTEVSGLRHVSRAAIGAQPLVGPAVIEEETSTTFVPDGWAARARDFGHLVIEPIR